MRALYYFLAGSALLVAQVLACNADTGGGNRSGTATPAGPNTSGGKSGTTETYGTDGGSSGSPEGGSPHPFEFVTNTMEFGGQARTYVVAKPKSYDATKSYPLVMAFHGNPSSAETMITYQPFATSGTDAIVVYPQAGSPSASNPGLFEWDIYTVTKDNADMNWIHSLVGELKKALSIDEAKVFAFGYSGGGFFISQFACRFSGYFRAIASHSGGGPDDEAMGFAKRPSGCFICPGGPTATLVTHGLIDNEVDPASGEFTASCYAETNGCSATRIATRPAPCEQYDGCPSDKPVKICMVPQQKHDMWANAASESWTFFRTLF